MLANNESSIDIPPIKRGSIFLEAGFLDWNIPEDKIVLCQYLSKKLPFETTDTIHSYSAWIQLIHPRDINYFEHCFKKNITKKNPYMSIEYRQLGRDGKWHWFNVWGKATQFDDQDAPSRVVGVCVEVTQYKENKINTPLQLLISEVSYTRNYKKEDDSPIMVCNEISKSFNKITNYSNYILLISILENLTSNLRSEVETSSFPNKNINTSEQSLEKNKPAKNFPITKNYLIKYNKKTSSLGIHLDLDSSSHQHAILIIESNEIEKNESFNEAILDLLESVIGKINNGEGAKRIREKRKELDSIIEFFIRQIPAPIAIFDTNMCHKFVSDTWKHDNSLGEPQEFTNKSYYEIYPEEPIIWQENHKKVLKGETITWEPAEDLNRLGESIWTEGAMLPWYALDGSIAGMIMYCNDVTKKIDHENILRNALDDLTQANQALKQSNESLESFAYICSHDLKEPLRGVANYIQLIFNKHAHQFDSDSIIYMRHALRGIDRINTLVQDILLYSKAIGKKTQSTVLLDLNSVIQEIKEDFKYKLAEVNGQLKIISPLPTLKAVRVQINQLFMNLIGNAIKFRSKNPLIIEIFSREKEAFWEIYVCDNGIGIEEEYQSRIFEVFTRLNSKHTYEGSGLGLSICQKIVEAHGGTITVQSNPIGGCDFIIKIPK